MTLRDLCFSLGRLKLQYVYTSILILMTFLLPQNELFSQCPVGPGVIINEGHLDKSSDRSYIELLVIPDPSNPSAPVNLEGWLIDDNNGDFEGGGSNTGISEGAIGLGANFNSIPPGSLIVIYNEDEKNNLIPANDHDDSNGDGVYIVPADHWSLYACTDLPSESSTSYLPCNSGAAEWQYIELDDDGDAVQIRRPDKSFFHGFSYGNVGAPFPTFPCGGSSFNVGNPGNKSSLSFSCGSWDLQENFVPGNNGSRTPGEANNEDNLVVIKRLQEGTYDHINLENPSNCDSTIVYTPPCRAGLIINNVYQDQNSEVEWVELLVVGDPSSPTSPVNLEGWIIDDNNGEFTSAFGAEGLTQGALGLGGLWNSVAPGSVIIIYNEAHKDPNLPADDHLDLNGDQIFIVAGNHWSLYGCSDFPTAADPSYLFCDGAAPSWSYIDLDANADAIQVRASDKSLYHGFSYGNFTAPFPSFTCGGTAWNIPSVGAARSIEFICGDWFDENNFEVKTAADRTTGDINSSSNLVTIVKLRSGDFDYTNPNNITNCEDPDITPPESSCFGGIVINEIHIDATGTQQWIELLVVGDPADPAAPVNLEGWLIDDNNGDFTPNSGSNGLSQGALGLGANWSSVNPGAIILIYNENDKDPNLPPDDHLDINGDDIFILAGNHWSLFGCSDFPSAGSSSYILCDGASPSWDYVQIDITGDAVQVRAPDKSLYHGFSFGDFVAPFPKFTCGADSWNINGPVTSASFAFTCGDWFDSNNFFRNDDDTRTGGGVNRRSNLVTISKLRTQDYFYYIPDTTIHCVDPSVVGLPTGTCAAGPGVVINELYQGEGANSNQEWVEFIVLGDPNDPEVTVDLEGWLFDDNNGEFEGGGNLTGITQGALGFGADWATVPPGSIIVIYNEANRDPNIPVDDPNDANGDGVYILPANHASLYACSAVPNQGTTTYVPCNGVAASWSYVSLSESGDAFQVRSPGGNFFQGIAFGDVTNPYPLSPCFVSSFNLAGAGTGTAASLECGSWNEAANYNVLPAAQGTPGTFNSRNNLTLITNIRIGEFNYADLTSPTNCSYEPPCYLAALGNNFLTGYDHTRNFEVDLGQYTNSSIFAVEFDPLTDSLFAADGGTLVYMDKFDGSTTSIGLFSPSITVNGLNGNYSLNNVKGLARDPVSNIWYGVQRVDEATACGDEDILFQFDPATGNVIQEVFEDFNFNTNGDDYVVIEKPSSNTCLHNITDLAYDPLTAKLYGIAVGVGPHVGLSILVEINVRTGATTDLGVITYDSGAGPANIQDIQGLSITTNNKFLITTGNLGAHANTLFELQNINNGSGSIAANLSQILDYNNYQGLTCQTFATLTSVGQMVYRDVNGDGDFNTGEPGIANVVMYLTQTATGDTIATTTTDAGGYYYFSSLYPSDYEVVISSENFLFGRPLYEHEVLGDPDGALDGKSLTTGLDFGDILHSINFGLNTVENCVNGVDDNGDGLVDCADPYCQNFQDFDNDGLGSYCDIDDDNDGITDIIEDNITTTSYIPDCSDDPDFDFSNPVLISGTDRREGAIYRYTEVIPGVDALVTIEKLENIAIPTADDESADQEWFKPQSNVNGLNTGDEAYSQYLFDFVETGTFKDTILEAINLFFIDIDGNGSFGEINWTEAPSSFTYDNPTDLSFVRDNSIQAYAGESEYGGITNNHPQANFFVRYVYATELRARFGIYAKQDGVSTGNRQHGLIFTCADNYLDPVTVSIDIDEDGIPNYIDLDSDNDGIYDGHEAGHPLTLDTEGRILNADANIGSNGLDNRVETFNDSDDLNYNLSDSEPTPDNTFDPYELDSDGDGCFDVSEASNTDADNDGLIGTSPVMIDINGKSISHSFPTPANNYWQDPNIIACGEICGDGVDNDLNGIVDCATIDGRIYEDINFGGGDGRNYTISNSSAMASGWSTADIGVGNVIVELYNDLGDFVGSTTTDALGDFAFVVDDRGEFFVRVVNHTVTSNRPSNGYALNTIPVQTFASDGELEIINQVGGRFPSLQDTIENSSSMNLSSMSSATAAPQSYVRVAIDTISSGGNLVLVEPTLSIDFGFNFDLIVNTNDEGQGSLRQFILNSNELGNTNLDQEDDPAGAVTLTKPPGVETSIFQIRSSTQTITPLSQLDAIRDDQVHLTGYTQLGSAPNSFDSRVIKIELDGQGALFDGLLSNTSDVTISGLAIHGFDKGIVSTTAGVQDVHIWGNYIGTDVTGTAPLSVPGNTDYGVDLRNLTDAFIGTNGDGVNDAAEGNLLSSNYFGAFLQNTSDVIIAGNYVGVERNGTTQLENSFIGISIDNAAGKNTIGFSDDLIGPNSDVLRNIISGNNTDGIRINNSDNQVIAGNFIGPDKTGLAAISNGNYGIQLQGSTSFTQIGTDSDGAHDQDERNIISGNESGYRSLTGGTGSDNVIAGNYIGVDSTGLAPLPNVRNGINVIAFDATRIGTNGDGLRDEVERNIISGNGEDGIRIADANNTIVAGNYIGVARDGSSPIGNGKRGILISSNSSDNMIGFHAGMSVSDRSLVGNVIRYNDDSGIAISDATSVRNSILSNSIAYNTGLGIDLDYDNVTANDNGDVDLGPNTLINFPVFEEVTWATDSVLTVRGFAGAGATVEFFISDGQDNPNPLPASYSTSFGEGLTYLFNRQEGSGADLDGTTGIYQDDGTGSVSNKTQNKFEFTFNTQGINLSVGTVISATLTDSQGNTSEFSGVFEVISANCGTATMNPHIMYYRAKR